MRVRILPRVLRRYCRNSDLIISMKKIKNENVIAIRQTIQGLIDDINTYEQSRFTSIVKTKLEEAQMWAGNLFSKDKTDGLIKRG